MEIITFTSGPIREHPYLIIETKSKEALLVDPGGASDEVIDQLTKRNATLKFIINTHFHPDHIAENALIKDMTGAQILIHKDDAVGLQSDWSNFSKKYNWPVLGSKADKLLKDNQLIKLGNLNFMVIHTPGHTRGSICLYCPRQDALFTGDTLFYHAIGRTDLAHSKPEKMKAALAKLLALPKATIIYPGHGPSSTIGEERLFAKQQGG